MTEEQITPTEKTAVQPISFDEETATWHDTEKALRFAMITRIVARVLLALVVVGFVYVTYDVVKNASAMPGQSLWRGLLGQYLAFVSLFMAVIIMEGIAHFIEILLDIEENTRK